MGDLPVVFVHQSIDLKSGETFEEPKVIKYENELKLRSLRKFVNQYALETAKQEDNIIKSAKKNHKAY